LTQQSFWALFHVLKRKRRHEKQRWCVLPDALMYLDIEDETGMLEESKSINKDAELAQQESWEYLKNIAHNVDKVIECSRPLLFLYRQSSNEQPRNGAQ
jgi:hypothetical protein